MTENRLWPWITQHLSTRFHIVGELDLVYSTHPWLLHQQLKDLYRQRYDSNDRILIYHFDTDFYFYNHGLGLYNLLAALTTLDISPGFCLLVTNHHGIESEIADYYRTYCPGHDYQNDRPAVLETNHTILLSEENPAHRNVNAEMITHHYSCLNGVRRSHRVAWLCLLADLDLLNKGILTWHFGNESLFGFGSDYNFAHQTMANDTSDHRNSAQKYLITEPRAHVRDWAPKDPKIQNAWTEYQHKFASAYQDPTVQNLPNQDRFHLDFIQQSFVHVISETVFDYPYPYLTEKTFRCFALQRPFIIVGAPGSLAYLRSLGFQTFAQYWDESYDCEPDHDRRMIKIANVVAQICEMPLAQLMQICYSMQDLFSHNDRVYRKVFAKDLILKKLQQL
jgi:hypothetical protein